MDIGILILGNGVNRTAVNKLITIMLVYSAIKINANLLLLYSILNPETNSDSPSDKSKGVRFVSASNVINHRRATGYRGKMGELSIDKGGELNDRVLIEQIKHRRIRAILIS